MHLVWNSKKKLYFKKHVYFTETIKLEKRMFYPHFKDSKFVIIACTKIERPKNKRDFLHSAVKIFLRKGINKVAF